MQRAFRSLANVEDRGQWQPADFRSRKRPALADGMVECDSCDRPFPAAALTITEYGHRCETCSAAAALVDVPRDVDPATVKIGRGRWWVFPIIVAAGGAFMLVAPTAALIGSVVAMLAAFKWMGMASRQRGY